MFIVMYAIAEFLRRFRVTLFASIPTRLFPQVVLLNMHVIFCDPLAVPPMYDVMYRVAAYNVAPSWVVPRFYPRANK